MVNFSQKQSNRSKIDPFIVMEVMNKANQLAPKFAALGQDVIHMEVGQPCFQAPKAALERAAQTLKTDRIGYTEALGLPELREAIAGHYKFKHGLSISPRRIIVTTGSSTAFTLAFLACFDAGDRVALPSPGYPCYRHIMTALGLAPVGLTLTAQTRWMPDAHMLQNSVQQDQIKGVILASPANPTGTMLSEERLASLVMAAHEQNIWFISDEIYHGLTYGDDAATALKYPDQSSDLSDLSDNVIVINSFSKYFCMTGWRIGWMVVPDHMVSVIERLAQNFFISPPTLSQYAALGALNAYEELEGYRKTYARNREILLNALPGCGFSELVPADGAFYIYADVSRYTDDSLVFADRILQDLGIALTPGLDFDVERGSQFLRFSYAQGTEDMIEAMRRLKGWDKG